MPQPDPIQGFTGLPAYLETYQIPDTLAAMYNFLLNRAIPRFATTTARDAALPSPTDGMVCVTGTGTSLVVWIQQAGAWKTLWQPPASTVPALTGAAGTDGFGLYRDPDGTVKLEGTVTKTSGNWSVAGDVAFTIPAGFRPAGFRRFALPAYASSSATGTLLASISGSTFQVTIQLNGSLATNVAYFSHSWRAAA
ncbi:hypothetical protein GCM10025864_39730 [Luteimicrobium album]|uniref:Uncharacterized protein n=1 Tax=Luteimicrobium album TaxID=1054550 RepID=A0ABQ6I601_9MICO|nr:hypothetical protein [Luteimicrobium album]GMA26214.1 hypothetical protein GCM10025864_39730 [Luteimicrobium album]